MEQRIDLTVAAVIERDERFLLVEERAGGQLVLNQPAGHVEPGESLLQAVIRETREETGFAFRPEWLVGVYLWHSPASDTSFLRTVFCGAAEPPKLPPLLDDGIVAVHWLKRAQLLPRAAALRSPMVLRCIDDYLAGTRYPLESVTHLAPTPLPATHSAAR